MTDIVDAPEKVRIVVCFEMGLKESLPVKIDLVLVRVKELCGGMVRNGLCRLVKGVRRQLVVMIAEDDVVALCKLQGCVGIFRDPQVPVKGLIAKALIRCGIFLQHLLNAAVRLLRAVRKDDLKAGIGLGLQGIAEHPQVFFRCMVGWDHDAEKRFISLWKELLPGLPLPLQCLLGDPGLFVPFSVVVVLLDPLDLVYRLLPQGPKAVLPVKVPGHLQGLRIAEGQKLFLLSVGHGIPLCDHFLVHRDPDPLPCRLYGQEIGASPFIGKLQVKAAHGIAFIDLGHVLPEHGHILQRKPVAAPVRHGKLKPAGSFSAALFRRDLRIVLFLPSLWDGPAV